MLLSIIIPTKNRYTTLFSIVEAILDFKYENLEIVIQDNSDDNSLALAFMQSNKESRSLKYFYENTPLSVIENSNRAVSNATGEYICFIGDDDGVLPNIIDVVLWMKEKGYEALKSYKPNYYWPNQKSNFTASDVSGILKYRRFKKGFEVRSTKQALNQALAKGGVSMKSLPCLYHGIVSKRALDLIFDRSNSYFPGPSPDMANAIALTQVLSEFVYVHYPVVISGKSTSSTGGAGVLHKHLAKIEEVAHLPKDTSDNWTKSIPKYWTGPTIWAESMVQALKQFNNQEAINKMNFDYLYAFLYVFNKNNRDQIFGNFKFEKKLKFYFYRIDIFIARVKTFVKNRSKSYFITKNNVQDIKQAIKILNDEI